MTEKRSGSRHQPWVWPVTLLSFMLGLLLAGSIQTVSGLRRTGSPSRVGAVITPTTDEQSRAFKDLVKQNTLIQSDKTRMENALAENGGQAKALNEELQKVKLTAGISEVHGPGIVFTLQDSKVGPPSNRMFEKENYIIHDVTLMRGINELNASGAEAISINGQRIVGRTAIRCVGPTAQVNGIPLASPYVIKVIGDPDTLAGGLNIPDGFMDFIRSYDREMARIEKKKDVVVAGYSGTTDYRFAKRVIVDEKPKPDRQRDKHQE